jgi:hypothetical protein
LARGWTTSDFEKTTSDIPDWDWTTSDIPDWDSLTGAEVPKSGTGSLRDQPAEGSLMIVVK